MRGRVEQEARSSKTRSAPGSRCGTRRRYFHLSLLYSCSCTCEYDAAHEGGLRESERVREAPERERLRTFPSPSHSTQTAPSSDGFARSSSWLACSADKKARQVAPLLARRPLGRGGPPRSSTTSVLCGLEHNELRLPALVHACSRLSSSTQPISSPAPLDVSPHTSAPPPRQHPPSALDWSSSRPQATARAMSDRSSALSATGTLHLSLPLSSPSGPSLPVLAPHDELLLAPR